MKKKFIGKFEVTKHAQIRMQQRSISEEVTDIILTFADRRSHIDGGSQALFVSRKRAKELVVEGKITPKLADRITSKSVVVSDDDNIVTAMHMKDGKRGRAYRKGRR